MREIQALARRVKLLLLDVDGVLTDGGLYYGPQGEALKRFDVKDGHGLVLWRLLGGRAGILTARRSEAVEVRARELKLDPVLQGQKDKVRGFEEACRLSGARPEEVCYVGDDLNDLAPLQAAGLAICPADACPEARQACHHVTQAPGGRGAVRELVELLLREQGRWDEAVRLMREGALPLQG